MPPKRHLIEIKPSNVTTENCISWCGEINLTWRYGFHCALLIISYF